MTKRYLITFSFLGENRKEKVDAFSELLKKFKLDFTTDKEDHSTYLGNSSTTTKGDFDTERNRLLKSIREFNSSILEEGDFIHFHYPERYKDVAVLHKVVIKK